MTNFKVYFLNKKTGKMEIRRFNTAVPHYISLCGELQRMFPELHNEAYTTSFIDYEGDEILISSDDELQLVLTDMINENAHSKRPYKICVTLPKKCHSKTFDAPRQSEAIHYRVQCDVCKSQIQGFRYKCLECDDYDLCPKCEAMGQHPKHYMIRLPEDLRSSVNEVFQKSWHGLANIFGIIFTDFHSIVDPVSCFKRTFFEKCTERKSTDSSGPSCRYSPSDKDSKKEEKNNEQNNLQTDGDTKSYECPQNSQPSNDNTVDKRPDKGTETVEEANDAKASMSHASSTTSIDTSNEVDGWRLVDMKETANISRASSAASSLKEAAAKEAKPTAPEETTQRKSIYPKIPETEVTFHPDPNIQKALDAMISMGFSNHGGLLTYLLIAENGNISKVLDFLQPVHD